MGTFADWQATVLAPRWLRRAWGALWAAALGGAKDAVESDARAAVKARLVAQAPADALPYVGAERRIERYPVDSDATYRARLASAWTVWDDAATSRGILARLADAGFSGDTATYNTHSDPPGDWPDAWPTDVRSASGWSRFWVEIHDPTPYAWKVVVWGATPTGSGKAWGDGAWTWGSDATAAEIDATRAIVRRWRPAHEVCAEIFVRLDETAPAPVFVRWPGA